MKMTDLKPIMNLKIYRKKERVVNFQSRIYRKDGSVIWLEWNAIYDKDLSIIYTVARDITDKKKLGLFRNESSKVLINLSSLSSLQKYSFKNFLTT